MAVLYSKSNKSKNNFLREDEDTKFLSIDKNVFSEIVVSAKNCQTVTKNEADNEVQKSKTFLRKYAGVLLALAAGIIFSLTSALIKFMKGYHPFTLALYNFSGLLLLSILFMCYVRFVQKQYVFQPFWPLIKKGNFTTFIFLCIRGLIGSCALILHFYALKHLTVADTTIIGTCRPVFVILLALVTLQEKCAIFPIFVAMITIFGVGVIVRPPILTNDDVYDDNILIGAGFAFSAMLLSAMAFTLVRHLRKIHFSVMGVAYAFCGVVMSLVVCHFLGEFKWPENNYDWMWAVLTTLFAFLGQSLMVLALKFEQASPVSLVRTSDPVFAFIWQFLFLAVTPDIFSLMGAAIVMFGVVLTIIRKTLSHLPEDHPNRKRFAFVLK